MSLENTINEQIKQAMLGKKEADLRGLRAIKSAILLANTSAEFKDGLKPDDEMKLLQKLVKTRRDSLDIYKQQNRNDLAIIEQEEIEVIERFLPKQLTTDEIKEIVKNVIADVGATSAADMGKVMGGTTKIIAGRADGKTVSAIVKELLG